MGPHFTLLYNTDKTKTHVLTEQLLTNLYASYKNTITAE